MKSLIIVGSAPLANNYSGFINSCDCVVRFNNCKNYGGNAGDKTDVLFITNSGNPEFQKTIAFLLIQRTNEEVTLQLPYLASAKQIWFVRPSNADLIDFLKKNFTDKNPNKLKELEDNAHKRDLAAEIIKAQNIPIEKRYRISAEFSLLTWKKLLQFGSTNAILPSTGILGIETILNNQLFDKFNKYIVGFGWEGWRGHPWMLEKKLVETYIQKKVLIPLDENKYSSMTARSLLSTFKRFFKPQSGSGQGS